MSLLFTITTDGVKPSHLLGTMHFMNQKMSELKPEVIEAINNSDQVILESVVNPEEIFASFEEMFSAGVLKNGTLEDAIGDREIYRRTMRLLRKKGFPEFMAKKFKPWVCVLLLHDNLAAVSMYDMPQWVVMPQFGFSLQLIKGITGEMEAAAETVDLLVQKHAKSKGKPVSSLENFGRFVSLFRDAPDSEILELMATFTEDSPAGSSVVRERIIAAYENGDLDEIGRLVDEMNQDVAQRDAASQNLFKNIGDRRTAGWMPRIEQYVRRGGAFIAVGAAHLVGDRRENGLLALLRARGFELTPIV